MRYFLKCNLLITAVLFVAFRLTALADEPLTHFQMDSLIDVGNGYLEEDKLDEAKLIFKKILKSDKNQMDALLGMGSIEFKKESWGDAKDWYNQVLDQEPDHLQANYGVGVCQREIGKNLILLQRYFSWRSSQKHFEKIYQIDSTYKDLLYQHAVLERYRRNYTKAIQLVHRQLNIHNDIPNVQIGIFRIYEYYLNNTNPVDVEEWLLRRNTPYDEYALGELYRRNEAYRAADSIFQHVVDHPRGMPLQPIYLAKVRMYIETENPKQAADAYWKGVFSIANRTEGELVLSDLYTIVNGEEYQYFKRNLSSGMMKRAIRQFWRFRDPMPAASYNHRLIEHYRRIIYAEKNYNYDGFRNPNYTDDKTHILEKPLWYSENYKYNDQGLIYIRFGEPDEKAFTLDGGIQPNMSWMYYPKNNLNKMIYHFAIPKDAPPGYWKLTPGFFKEEHSVILEQMLHWDGRFQRMLLGDQMEISAIEHEMAVDRAKTVDKGFKTDQHTWNSKTTVLNMNHDLAQFRQSENKDLIQLAYSIPLLEIFSEDHDSASVVLETGIALFDQNMKPVDKETRTFTLDPNSDPHYCRSSFIDEFEFPIELKDYNIAFHAQLMNLNKLNGWRFYHPLKKNARNNLALSSLKVAYSISMLDSLGGRTRENLKMIPSVDKVFQKQDPLYTYFEIYNLSYDASGNTKYTTSFILKQISDERNFFQKLGGLFSSGSSYEITVQSDHVGKTRKVTDFISFDLSKASKGTYELQLTVKDNLTGAQVQASTDLILE